MTDPEEHQGGFNVAHTKTQEFEDAIRALTAINAWQDRSEGRERPVAIVKIHDWYWHIEVLQLGRILATRHFLSTMRLQVEGANADELYNGIAFAMVEWLRLVPR